MMDIHVYHYHWNFVKIDEYDEYGEYQEMALYTHIRSVISCK